MSIRYNYSVQRRNAEGNLETLQVTNCDSFDEAIKVVGKGLHDRQLYDEEIIKRKTEEIERKKLEKTIVTGVKVADNVKENEERHTNTQ